MGFQVLLRKTDDPAAGLFRWKRGHVIGVTTLEDCFGGADPETTITVVVSDSGATADFKYLTESWYRKTAYAILAADLSRDWYSVKVYTLAETLGAKSEGKITAADMQAFLQRWGAQIDEAASTDNDVRFTLDAVSALNAQGFIDFGTEEEFVNFTETAYDVESGTHSISMDYSLSSLNSDRLEKFITDKGLTIVSHDRERAILVFTVTRTQLIQALEAGVEREFNKQVAMRRWKIDLTGIETFITDPKFPSTAHITLSDFQARIVDLIEG